MTAQTLGKKQNKIIKNPKVGIIWIEVICLQNWYIFFHFERRISLSAVLALICFTKKDVNKK